MVEAISKALPTCEQRSLTFAHGEAIGISHRWFKGQYCAIITKVGLVGCGIYDVATAGKFGQVIAIARGTPSHPLVTPEDLFGAKIVEATPQALTLGIHPGMTGREAVEIMLQQEQTMRHLSAPIRVQNLDHVTLVVKDLEQTRRFYLDLLGLEEVPRPGFTFSGAWFQAGNQQIHLIVESTESGPAGQPKPEGRVGNRTHHFAFQVADARAAGKVLQERGHEIISGPKERPDGAVQVFVCDPDDYVVELCSLPNR